MKLIDTNVFIYAAGRPHLYKEPCLNILARIATGEQGYAIDAELLQEILHSYALRRVRDVGVSVFDRTLALFPSPLPVTVEELRAARNLMQRYSDLYARDAIHAAFVLVHSFEGLVSADQIFDKMSELKRFDPQEL